MASRRLWTEPRSWAALLVVASVAYRASCLLRPFDWIVAFFTADDFYYYTQTAWNLAHGHGSSVDGGFTSHNGYHPLYVWLLVPAYALGAGKVAGAMWGLWMLVLANAAAVWFAWRVASRLGDPWLALLPAASLALSMEFVHRSLDGFGTPLTILLLLLLVDALQRRRPGWQLGLLLGLASMARVEASLAALPLAAVLAHQRRWRDLALCAGTSLLVAAPWIVWSSLRFGTPLPGSGVVKAALREPTAPGLALEVFFAHLLNCAAGSYWQMRVGETAVVLAGVAILLVGLCSWRRTWALLLFAAVQLALFTCFAEPRHSEEFDRFVTPACLAVLLAAVAVPLPPRLAKWTWIAPLALLALLARSDKGHIEWSWKTTAEDRYIGTCQRQLPPILARIRGSGDRIGSFDSGAMGYFSEVPVTNLDGLVNSEIVELLRGSPAADRERLYRSYLARKGITIVVGNDRFAWHAIFSDVERWEALAPPIELSYGAKILFLRVPPP
jgi:hypothetical protein